MGKPETRSHIWFLSRAALQTLQHPTTVASGFPGTLWVTSTQPQRQQRSAHSNGQPCKGTWIAPSWGCCKLMWTAPAGKAVLNQPCRRDGIYWLLVSLRPFQPHKLSQGKEVTYVCVCTCAYTRIPHICVYMYVCVYPDHTYLQMN